MLIHTITKIFNNTLYKAFYKSGKNLKYYLLKKQKNTAN